MCRVYSIGDNLYTPIGATTASNWGELTKNITGVSPYISALAQVDYAYASVFDKSFIERDLEKIDKDMRGATQLEKMMVLSVSNALIATEIDVANNDTLFIFSTTKGNIELLKNKNITGRLSLFEMASYVSRYFGNVTTPIVVSNACISGVLAINIAATLIKRKIYKNVVVVGGDMVSEFVISGFHSFQALSRGVCRPFDQNRDGINLGEAVATIILSSNKTASTDIEIIAGATSNDANHISGPSRSGDGLAHALEKCIEEAKISGKQIQHVVTHGTATLYNDEMEAKALTAVGLEGTCINSLKGYYGHTLGAAGVVETIVAIHSMKRNLMLKSYGYQTHGVSVPLNVLIQNTSAQLQYVLKTASGFGGCNAALILKNNG